MRIGTKRLGLVAGVLVVPLVCAAAGFFSEAQAGGGRLDPVGEPKGFHKGESVRYAIWHNKHGWHVRSTTELKEHRFKGRIRVEGGVFEKVRSHDLEKEGKLADWWRLGSERHEVTFEFKTDRGLDGIDFHTSKSAKRIHFAIHIDGRAEPERVFVGRFDQHPIGIPFDLPAHP